MHTIEDLFNQAIIAEQANEFAAAEKLYKQILAQQREHLASLYNLGNIFNKIEKYTEAIDYYLQALKQAPREYQIHYNLALALFNSEQLLPACQHFQWVINLQPTHFGATHALACTLLKLDRPQEAVPYLQQAIHLQPNDAEPYFNIGILLLNQNKLDAAASYFSCGIERDPQMWEAYYNLAIIAHQQEKIAAAVDYFEKVLTINPASFQTHYQLTLLYKDLNLFVKAQEHCQQGLTLDPSDATLTYFHKVLSQTEIPDSAPDDYIIKLFDNYAPHYEQHVRTLEYEPEKIYSLTLPLLQEKTELDILDLGCGTGLLGKYFRAHAQRLVGVDLSKEMLARASEKNYYHELHHASIQGQLDKFSDPFDLILAIEVWVYFGKLESVFAQIVQCLKLGGLFIFTVECSGQDYALTPTGRYTHSSAYILNTLKKLAINLLLEQKIVLRKHRSIEQTGYLYILEKVAS